MPTSDHDSFDSWARATQAYQSMVLRRQIEVLRRLKYHPTGGFAYALLADPWPAISMSVLDHRRRAKTGYQALADACRPVIVVADRLPAAVRPNQSLGLDVHVVSDLREILESVRVTARLGWRDGEHTWSWEGSVPADSCVRVGTISIVVPEAYGPLSLDLDVATADRASSNRYHSMITT